jgi:hypothetical protein
MKAILTLVFTSLLLGSCEVADKNQSPSHVLEHQLSDAERLHLINEWQIFKKASGESMLLAQEKINRLRKKQQTQKTADACQYKLNKLKTKLRNKGIRFKCGINHFTAKDTLKNQAFRIAFVAKLNDLHVELDALLNQP